MFAIASCMHMYACSFGDLQNVLLNHCVCMFVDVILKNLDMFVCRFDALIKQLPHK